MADGSPKITSMVVSLNSVGTIRALLDSFFEQTYRNKELVVVDGGSTDGTAAIIDSYSPHYSVSEPDAGLWHAWNKCVDRATGEWLHLLGADDKYKSPSVLSDAAVRILEGPKHTKVFYGQVEHVESKGRVVDTLGAPWNATLFRTSGMTIPTQAAFLHRTLFEKYGRFERGHTVSDYEFLLRHLKDHDAAFLPGLLVAQMGVNGVSSDPANHLMIHREFRRAQRIHGTEAATLAGTVEAAKAWAKFLLFAGLPRPRAIQLWNSVRYVLGKPVIHLDDTDGA